MMDIDRIDSLLIQDLHGFEPLDEVARNMLSAGGKRLRARATLIMAELMGVNPAQALPWALANEWLHNASLVHDDIQDRDHFRRGRPTVWAEHGVELAISLGDHLLMKPFLFVHRIPVEAEIRLQLQEDIALTVSRMAQAQVQEHRLRADDPALREKYLAVIAGKTSALFELPVLGLCRMLRTSASETRDLVSAFHKLGEYFQVLDDLKDIRGLKGKPERGADLCEGKISAIVIAYLELRPERARDLAVLLQARNASAPLIQQWLVEFESSGAVSRVEEWLDRLWHEFQTQLPTRLQTCCDLFETLMKPNEKESVCLEMPL